MYHAVGTPIPDDTQGRYTLTETSFLEQMQTLKASGQTLVSLGSVLPQEGVAVTFDDGYRDNFLCAYPILKQLGIPFTIFVTTANLDSPNSIYLTRNDLRALAADPLVTIGAHGFSHTPLTKLDDVALQREMASSKKMLEDVIGCPVVCMSYPHGAFDARVIEAARQAGYEWAASSKFGCNGPGIGAFSLLRTDVWSSDSIGDFGRKLAGRWDWLGLRS